MGLSVLDLSHVRLSRSKPNSLMIRRFTLRSTSSQEAFTFMLGMYQEDKKELNWPRTQGCRDQPRDMTAPGPTSRPLEYRLYRMRRGEGFSSLLSGSLAWEKGQ